MNLDKKPKNIQIIYFSGTGGTKRASELLAESFIDQNVSVNIYEINHSLEYTSQKTDLLIILYPVYALNAPKPVYSFIQSLHIVKKIPAAIISVSGGGEITPNTASRLHCIRRLTDKGYRVVYEGMLVLPSNIFVATPDDLSARLLQILPSKVDQIRNDLLNGVIKQTNPNLFNRFFSFIGEVEKLEITSWIFGKNIQVSSTCTRCGLCQKGCPMGNITLSGKLPMFGSKCVLCLKCIYFCPKKALLPRVGKFIILKKGYNLTLMDNKSFHNSSMKNDKRFHSYVYKGIMKYLYDTHK